jgi:hypothetical protein
LAVRKSASALRSQRMISPSMENLMGGVLDFVDEAGA